MKDWTFEEMFAKSDLAAITTPIATFETKERTALEDLSPLFQSSDLVQNSKCVSS
jgi:hypothetical protein